MYCPVFRGTDFDRVFLYSHFQSRQSARAGDFDDALRNKKALVIPMILEAFGGISRNLYTLRRPAPAGAPDTRSRGRGARGPLA
jgi:hypothetical protein